MEVPDLYKNLSYSEKMSREVTGLITQAQQANGSFEVPRSYEDAARWLMSRNCLVIEGYDDNSLLCYLPEDVNGDLLIDSFKYWGDQFNRLEEVNRRLRKARLDIIMNDYIVAVTPPEADADATDWELYATRLELKLITLESRRDVGKIAASVPRRRSSGVTREQLLARERRSDGSPWGVVLLLVLGLPFFIYLLYLVFNN